MSIDEPAAKALRGEMAYQNILRAELADRLGVHVSWVRRRLWGQTDISVQELDRMASALGVRAVLDPKETGQVSFVRKASEGAA